MEHCEDCEILKVEHSSSTFTIVACSSAGVQDSRLRTLRLLREPRWMPGNICLVSCTPRVEEGTATQIPAEQLQRHDRTRFGVGGASTTIGNLRPLEMLSHVFACFRMSKGKVCYMSYFVATVGGVESTTLLCGIGRGTRRQEPQRQRELQQLATQDKYLRALILAKLKDL